MIRLDLPNCRLHESSKSDMEVPTVQDTLQFKGQTKSPPKISKQIKSIYLMLIKLMIITGASAIFF